MLVSSNKWLIRGLLLSVFVAVAVILLMLPKQSGQNPDLTSPTQQFPYLVYFCKSQGDTTTVEGVKAASYPEAVTDKTELLDDAVNELLAGPTDTQKKDGYFSEIPDTTKLIGIKTTPKEIRINLSEDFNSGGGSNSVINRFEQLRKTVVSFHFEKPVYLDLNGEPAEVLGGEGLEIESPINEGEEAA